MRYVSATCSEYLLNKEVKFSFTATFVFVKQRSYEHKKDLLKAPTILK